MEIQEAWKLRNLEVWRPGDARAVKAPSQEPRERGLEIQEAWKLGNLEVWRLGGLGEPLDDLPDRPRSL